MSGLLDCAKKRESLSCAGRDCRQIFVGWAWVLMKVPVDYEYSYPQTPLLPEAAADRATVRAICNAIACDIQPVQNLRVLKYVGADKKMEWV